MVPGNSIIQFDISPKPYRGSVVSYIRDVWARQAPLENLGKIDVNGMRAATAIARISRQGKSFDVRFVAIRQNPRRIFRFIFLTPFRMTQQLSVPLRRTTFSLRTISPGEAARFQPQRLRIRAVRPGDRARRFISQMAMRDFKAEWFAVLNGLNPGQRLRRGQLVKIVTENIGE